MTVVWGIKGAARRLATQDLAKLGQWFVVAAFRLVLLPLVALIVASACTRAPAHDSGDSASHANEAAEAVVDCSFLDAGLGLIPTQAILKVAPSTRKVLNLSFVPPRSGTATVTESGYVLEFSDLPVLKERFTINRYTDEGRRELIDEHGKVGSKDSSIVTCKPYQGKPF